MQMHVGKHIRYTVIQYEQHRATDFEGFLLSLKSRNGGKPGISVYNSFRSALFHLYRGYGRSMDVDFAADVTLFFKGLKRETAKRNHDSGEKLTEGKDPLLFSMLVNVLPELPISDVTAKNRQRRKQQLKWSSVLQEIRENRRRVNN
ncbi:hypothetical protein F443_15947 [Phytophthora nicotianae P1569]|uniref:Uncharacterized protein n=1 Tax=Phytophthora nicotianae P1569 TaxID=1317065 RepID=V9EH29_PHYNI|nr:hypothetical protein F443_15947 [Phytophthora nicotianae P1569]